MYVPKLGKKEGERAAGKGGAKRPAGKDASPRTLARACAAMAAVTVMSAAFACWTWWDCSQRYAVLEQDTVQAVVAQRDIATGEMVEASAVAVEAVPAGNAPAGAATGSDQVAGKVALADIPARSTVTASQVSGDAASTLAGRVAEGKVAVTAAVTPQSGGAGLVRQGDTVTLFGSFGGGDSSAKEIVRGARVLACGGNLDAVDESYATLTVEVTRDQAAAVAVAESAGSVTFVVEPAAEGR